MTVPPAKLVAFGAKLRAQIAILAADLKDVETALQLLGKGKYEDDKGNACNVIVQAEGEPTYKLKAEDLERARQLAAEDFAQAFDRTVLHTPCKGFVDVVPKLFTPARARDLLALCRMPGKAGCTYVKWK